MRDGVAWAAGLVVVAAVACSGSSPPAGGSTTGVVDAGTAVPGPDASVECEELEDPSDRLRCEWVEMVGELPACRPV